MLIKFNFKSLKSVHAFIYTYYMKIIEYPLPTPWVSNLHYFLFVCLVLNDTSTLVGH